MTKIKCLKCGDILTGDKEGNLYRCKCGNTYIEENEYCCRIGYDNNYKILRDFKIKKQKKEKVKNYEKERNREKGNSNKSDKD